MGNINFQKAFEAKIQDGKLQRSELRALANQARKTPEKTDDLLVGELERQFKDGDRFHLVDVKLAGVEIKGFPSFDFVDDIKAPSAAEVKAGKAVIGANAKIKQEGPAVKIVQQRLNQLGFHVDESGVMDNRTRKAVEQFQAVTGCNGKGKDDAGQIGAVTWKRLNQLTENASVRQTMTDTAIANSDRAWDTGSKVMLDHGTKTQEHAQGYCYTYVAIAADAASRGQHMTGQPAYEAIDSLKQDPRYQKIQVSQDQLKHLLPGTVVVWEKGGSDYGHISIADGHGNEVSDFIRDQQTTHHGGGGYHVYLPVK